MFHNQSVLLEPVCVDSIVRPLQTPIGTLLAFSLTEEIMVYLQQQTANTERTR